MVCPVPPEPTESVDERLAAEPLTLPVTLPVKLPKTAVVVNIPEDGLYVKPVSVSIPCVPVAPSTNVI